jgi:uncharacterized membrane protein
VYALVIAPQLRGSEAARSAAPAFARSFGAVVRASAWTLLATGGYLTFDRLTNTRLAVPYALVLALKVLLVIWMLLLAGALGRSRGRRRAAVEAAGPALRWRGLVPVPTLILALGLAVFLLSAVLTTLYQAAG